MNTTIAPLVAASRWARIDISTDAMTSNTRSITGPRHLAPSHCLASECSRSGTDPDQSRLVPPRLSSDLCIDKTARKSKVQLGEQAVFLRLMRSNHALERSMTVPGERSARSVQHGR